MDSFKTSYILTKDEMLYLLSSLRDVRPSHPAQYIINQYLSSVAVTQGAIEGLIYKKLVNKSSEKTVLEPVIDLFVRAALSSESIWIVECSDIKSPVLIIKTRDMYLYISCYTHISDAWKVTPYQTKDVLLSELGYLNILTVTFIDKNGIRHQFNGGNNTFLEESI